MGDDFIEESILAKGKTGPVATAAAAEKDLSGQVESAIEREPLDWVRCVRVFGDYYRCNWWSRKGQRREGQDFDFGGLITDYVRKSRFLKVTMQMGQLVVEER